MVQKEMYNSENFGAGKYENYRTLAVRPKFSGLSPYATFILINHSSTVKKSTHYTFQDGGGVVVGVWLLIIDS